MEIYVVGGAVRDEILGLEPQDLDYVVVGATHDDMIQQGFQQVGADFPVYLHPKTGDEYALARTERKTGNGYHGFAVDASPLVTLEQDLSRRDLTINAMARSARGNWMENPLIDPFNGMTDLLEKRLRHVSDAFSEDPLRVIRLARFFARYSDFAIDVTTTRLALDLIARGELNHLPKERLWTELVKVFSEEKPERFFTLVFTWSMDVGVRFFNEVYGTLRPEDSEVMIEAARAVTAEIGDPVERMLYHVALTAPQDVPHADSRTRVATRNVRTLRGARRTADDAYGLLKQAKAWGEGNSFRDLITAAEIDESMGNQNPFGPADLEVAAEVARSVSAATFSQIPPGPALGRAIEEARKAEVKKVLDL